MSTKAVTPEVKAKQQTVTLAENESAIIVNQEIEHMISEAYVMQDDIENASKFTRAFLFDAVKSRLAYNINATVSQWERVLDKANRIHPTKTREELTKELMVSKKAKSLYEKAQLATEAKKKL